MKGQRKNKHSIAIKIIIFFLFVLICIGLTFVIGYFHYTQGLPELTSLEGYKPHAVSKIYGDDGQLIGQYYLENRIVIPVNKMPQKLMEAFIAAEDARFFEHSGVDLFSILRATIKNVMAGEIIQGGSTITQQLVKSFFLTSEKSLSRKIKEAILAYRVENFLTKREILYLYLNQIYLGNGAYGVETASQSYFGKHVYELNLAEIAMLAGLPKAPSVFAPTVNFEKSLERQNYVLERMQKNGYITNDEMEDAKKKEIKIIPKEKRLFSKAPYFTEYIKQYVTQKYGEDLFYKGLKIYTPLSPAMQQVAEQAVRKGLLKLDKRQGFRGPIKRITVKEMNSFCTNQSAEFEKSGISFGKTYEGVVISSDKKTHKVVVQIGGYIGSISKRSGQWALRKNHLNIKTHSFAELFDTGHVIYVKVNSYNKKSHTLNLSLEQEPEVEAALISIDPRT
ncbi:MAG: transglycosylase domain-containing protein, partial [Thermodesulfobacteriota bacterium]|nr:transglycosylase domain-containing protein [Thermodesulfobacteriota bacterium]